MSTAGRPNILLVVADCARADKWLGGGRPSKTPNLDRLAAEGVACSTVIAETACTTPCFAAMLTGAFSFRHGIASVGGYRLVDELPTLPQVLKSHGYHTYFEATGPLLPLAGLTRGFDEYNYRIAMEYLHSDWGVKFIERLRSGGFKAPWFIVLHLWELHLPRQVLRPFRSRAFGRTPYDRAVSSLDSQLPRLREAAGANTLWLFTGDHGEKTAEESYQPGTAVTHAAALYGADRTPAMGRFGPHKLLGPVGTAQLRARFQPRLEAFSQRETPRQIGHGLWRRLSDTWQILKLAPSRRITDLLRLRSDAGRAKVVAERGVLDESAAASRLDRLIAALGEDRVFDMYLRMWAGMLRLHLLAGHVVHVYDFLTRVPLVLHWPEGLRGGLKTDRLLRQVDIGRTILDLIGVEPPPGFSPDGRTFKPLIEGAAWTPHPAYLSVTGQPRDLTLRGIRTETHRFVYGPADNAVPRELYDLRTDPGERMNIAAREPALCEELRATTEAMLPVDGPRVRRLDDLTPAQQRQIETRLRELGYVE
ncbi:MAG: hypothetical protein AMXMBFR47_29070 [Planctomycetota bacterium]